MNILFIGPYRQFDSWGYKSRATLKALQNTSHTIISRPIFLSNNIQFNQPILIKDVFILLDKVKGVQTVKNVKFSKKVAGNYSQFANDMDAATQNQVIYPSLDPSVFELRYPNEDIKGRVVPL